MWEMNEPCCKLNLWDAVDAKPVLEAVLDFASSMMRNQFDFTPTLGPVGAQNDAFAFNNCKVFLSDRFTANC